MARQGLIHSAQRSSVDPSPHARRLRRIMLLIHQAVGRCDAGAAVDPGPCSRLVRAATRSPAAPADLLPPEVSSIGAIPTGIVLVCVSGWRHSGQYLIHMSRSWAFRPCPSGTPSTPRSMQQEEAAARPRRSVSRERQRPLTSAAGRLSEWVKPSLPWAPPTTPAGRPSQQPPGHADDHPTPSLIPPCRPP